MLCFKFLWGQCRKIPPLSNHIFCETNLSGSLIDILMLFECGLDFADIQYSLSRIRTFECAVSLTPQSKTTSIWFYFLCSIYSTFFNLNISLKTTIEIMTNKLCSNSTEFDSRESLWLFFSPNCQEIRNVFKNPLHTNNITYKQWFQTCFNHKNTVKIKTIPFLKPLTTYWNHFWEQTSLRNWKLKQKYVLELSRNCPFDGCS